MQEQYRVTVPLSKSEFVALSKSAQRELRPIRDQARYMLRNALLTDSPDPPTTNEGYANVSEAAGAPFCVQS